MPSGIEEAKRKSSLNTSSQSSDFDQSQRSSPRSSGKLRSGSNKSFGSDLSLDSSSGPIPSPTITITSERGTSYKSAEQKPEIRKPLVPPKPKSQSFEGESFTKSIDLGTRSEKEPLAAADDEVPIGYDPVEYDYLMQQNDGGDENEVNDIGLSASARSASNSSLVCFLLIYIDIYIYILHSRLLVYLSPNDRSDDCS